MAENSENWGLGPGYSTKSPVAAFDCDETLWSVDCSGNPTLNAKNRRTLNLLRAMRASGFRIVVWSGGGRDHAERCGRFCDIWEIVEFFASKTEAKEIGADISFDDCIVNLARINVQL